MTQEFWNDKRATIRVLTLTEAKRLAHPGCDYCQEAIRAAENQHAQHLFAKKWNLITYDIIGPVDKALNRIGEYQ